MVALPVLTDIDNMIVLLNPVKWQKSATKYGVTTNIVNIIKHVNPASCRNLPQMDTQKSASNGHTIVCPILPIYLSLQGVICYFL